METIGTWWMWAGFAVFVVIAIGVDLLVMERQGAHKVTMGEAARWSLLWFSLAFVFVAILWWYLDSSQGREVASLGYHGIAVLLQQWQQQFSQLALPSTSRGWIWPSAPRPVPRTLKPLR